MFPRSALEGNGLGGRLLPPLVAAAPMALPSPTLPASNPRIGISPQFDLLRHMKNASDCAKRLTTLLKRLPGSEPPDFSAGEEESSPDPVAVLIASFLLWESNSTKALTAWKNLNTRIVDYNDLRVCMPQEVLEFIGVRYPRGLERCQRLRASLRDIYHREHAVRLDSLEKEGKRESRRYLESLEGMVPYVAARVSLLCFGSHAVPVDDQLRSHLIAVGAADDSAEIVELSSWLERHIKADDAVVAHHTLQGWVDRGGGEPKARSRTTKKPAARKTKKKAPTKRPRTAGRS